MIPRAQKRGHSFKGVSTYLLHDKEAKTNERVLWSETGNLYTNDIEKAAKVMAWTDSNAEMLKKNAGISTAGRKAEAGAVYHYSLAWAHGENPDQEHMRNAVLETLERQGLEDRQFFMVAHDDTKHSHVHVVVNLTNQEDGTRADYGLNKRILQEWALEYEQEHGLHCAAREKNHELRKQDNAKEYYPTQTERYGVQVTRAFELSDNADSFKNALENEGLSLAQGRRSFVAVNEQGQIINLARVIEGHKTKDIKARLGDLDRDNLPNADELAEKLKQEYEAKQERTLDEIQEDTAARVEELEEMAHDPMQDLQGWLDEDIHGNGQGNNQNILSSGSGGSLADDNALQQIHTDENGNFDRDGYEAAQQDKLELEAIAQLERQEALESRAADIIKGLQIGIKKQAKLDWAELKARQSETMEEKKQALRLVDSPWEEKHRAYYQGHIDDYNKEKTQLEKVNSSLISRAFFRFKNGISAEREIDNINRSIEDAQTKLDNGVGGLNRADYLRIKALSDRQADIREELRSRVDRELNQAEERGLQQAKQEQENAVLREAQASPEAAERLIDQIQPKTAKQRGEVAKVKSLAREQRGKVVAKEQNAEKEAADKATAQESQKERVRVRANVVRDEQEKTAHNEEENHSKGLFDNVVLSRDFSTQSRDSVELSKEQDLTNTGNNRDLLNIEQAPDQGNEPER